MQVIDGMPKSDFDAVCEVGARLVAELVRFLERSGCNIDQAPHVLAVAAAGITKGFGIEGGGFGDRIEELKMLWRIDQDSSGGKGIVFDPPHLRPDFVPVVSDGSDN